MNSLSVADSAAVPVASSRDIPASTPAIGTYSTVVWEGVQRVFWVAVSKCNLVSQKIESATGHKLDLAKVLPITLGLLLAPSWVAMGIFAVGVIVKVIHPNAMIPHANLLASLAQGLGIISAFSAIENLTNPATVVAHLVIFVASFYFASQIQKQPLESTELSSLGVSPEVQS